MNTNLPDDIREALRQAPGEPLELFDEESHAKYFIVRHEFFHQAVAALQEQADLKAIAAGIAEMEAGLGRPLAEADADMRQKLGFPPRS